MLREVLTVSALIVVVLLVRAIFKNRVPKRMIYALWLVVLLKLCLPGTLFSLPVLSVEDAAVPAQSAERPVQTAPVIQRPAQTVTKPQTPAQQPVSPVQETAKPAAKPLTTAQILQIVWFSGSALLGLWLFGAWAVFTIRLRRDRRFLGKRSGTCIYVSDAVKSPCLAGLIPAVYLTEDVLQTDEAELILSHELTHLRHLDFLWSFCRTAAVMLTSCTLTPSSSQSFTALDFVRFVVPKQGIVTHWICFRLRPQRSNARTHTRSASVLSSPPEMPSTTVFACVCSIRFLRPCDWMRRIASARARSWSS